MAPNKKKEKEPLPKSEYRKVLSGLELKDIYFQAGKFSLKRKELLPESIIKISDNSSYEVNPDGSIELIHTYKLGVTNKENRKKSLNIECSICLTLLSKEKFSDEFFEVYKKINLPIHTWPFLREYLFNVKNTDPVMIRANVMKMDFIETMLDDIQLTVDIGLEHEKELIKRRKKK